MVLPVKVVNGLLRVMAFIIAILGVLILVFWGGALIVKVLGMQSGAGFWYVPLILLALPTYWYFYTRLLRFFKNDDIRKDLRELRNFTDLGDSEAPD